MKNESPTKHKKQATFNQSQKICQQNKRISKYSQQAISVMQKKQLNVIMDNDIIWLM